MRKKEVNIEDTAQNDSDFVQNAEQPSASQTAASQGANSNEAQITELTNDLQRTRADFENYRRQVDIQREQYAQIAREGMVKKILPLLDDIDRATEAAPEVMAPLAKNIEKTVKSLGLEKISPKEGEEFNPDLHNAVMVEGDGDVEKIATLLQPGYIYDGQTIRAAMVKVEKTDQ